MFFLRLGLQCNKTHDVQWFYIWLGLHIKNHIMLQCIVNPNIWSSYSPRISWFPWLENRIFSGTRCYAPLAWWPTGSMIHMTCLDLKVGNILARHAQQLDVFTKKKSHVEAIHWWDNTMRYGKMVGHTCFVFRLSVLHLTGWQCFQPIFLCWTPQPLRPGTSARMSLSHRDECPGSNLRPVFNNIFYYLYIYIYIFKTIIYIYIYWRI